MAEAIASCRICAGTCALRLTLDDGRIVAVHGDRSNPLTRGYACIKGLTLHEAHASPDRLHHPLRRREDGGFDEIPLETALDEIADRLDTLIGESGPQSIAAFKGTMAYTNFLANAMLPAFLGAIGSNAYYSTMTVDQSAKWVTFERLGGWEAGKDSFEVADVLLIVGSNPLVSLSTFNFVLQNPVKAMREARARGLKLIVIDPRETETARHADVFLQPLPGEDPAVLAGLIHIILDKGWHDAEFCAAQAAGLDTLARAVAPFTPSYVAARAGVPEEALREAAALFAAPVPDGGGLRRKRGSGASGTGPNMAAHSNLSEHLLECLNVVCGRFARAGDRVMNPGVLGRRMPRRAQVIAPRRSWEEAANRAPGGYGMLFGERMSGALIDDIMADSPSRVRALIVDGGNPAVALPDPRRTAEGLRALDLLVSIDPFLTPTARLSHYVIPPTMMLERHDVGSRDYEAIVTFAPYGRYDAPVIAPPPGSEATDDWIILWEILRRMGRGVTLDGERFDMERRPTSEELIALLLRESAVPLEEIRRHAAGHIFDVPPMTVAPRDPADMVRFDLAPADILAEIAVVRTEQGGSGEYTHRLSVRRMRDVQNTMFHHLPSIRTRVPTNAAWLHPDDLTALALGDGDPAMLSSCHGRIDCIVRSDPSVRPGVVSITHGWGGLAGESGPEAGVNVNALASALEQRDPINAMPLLSGFPVRIERVAQLVQVEP
jgi:anaerobic selenocysteine-containing dehydrogenase